MLCIRKIRDAVVEPVMGVWRGSKGSKCSPRFCENSVKMLTFCVTILAYYQNTITLQPHYNTVVYRTNSVITWLRLGSYCLYSLYIRPSL